MTVHVQTERGKKSYPHADGYEYDPEFGFLNILAKKAEDAEIVGTYPPGSWSGVAIEVPEPKAEEVVDAEWVPRVWESLVDVPVGLRVRPEQGDRYDIDVLPDGTGWYVDRGKPGDRRADGWNLNLASDGPFTEVIA